MPVSASERIAKYKSKFDPTVVGARFTGVKSLAESKTEVRQSELAQIRDDIRAILNQNKIAPLWSGLFQAFSNRLYHLVDSGGSLESLQPIAQAEAQAWLSTLPTAEQAKRAINDILVYYGFSPLP
jgi:hypothetical protein